MAFTKETAKNPVLALVTQLGALRLMLAALAMTAIGFVQKAGTSPVYTGWDLGPTVIAPVMAPLVLMLLMLDVLMSRVMMLDKKGGARRRLRHIIAVELLLALGLVMVWLPYFLALGNP